MCKAKIKRLSKGISIIISENYNIFITNIHGETINQGYRK